MRRGPSRPDLPLMPIAKTTRPTLALGDFDALVRAIRTGEAYANMHTATFPSGDPRADRLAPGAAEADVSAAGVRLAR